MSRFGRPARGYDERDQIAFREAVERADGENIKKGRDYEVGAARIILTSPNGTRYVVTVDNAGALGTTPA